MNNGNDMAFPDPHHYGSLRAPDTGLTKRELLAAMAMQGMLANPGIFQIPVHLDKIMETITLAAIEHADDLLRTLETTPSNQVNK